MDAKITLSFNKEVIAEAKKFAEEHSMSLSRLTEFLYAKITSGHYKSIDKMPVSEWVNILAEGKAVYITKRRSRKQMKKEYYNRRK